MAQRVKYTRAHNQSNITVEPYSGTLKCGLNWEVALQEG